MFEEIVANLFYIFKGLIKSKEFPFIASVFMLILIVKWQFPKLKGAVGEWKVKSKLKQLGEEYTSFHDVYMPTKDGNVTRVDHIVTSPYGVFVIETKHYDGWIFGNEFKPYWTQVIYKKKIKMYNPIRQNYGHVQAVITLLEQIDEEDVHSIIAFSTQSTFKFKETFKTAKVIQFPQLLETLYTYQAKRLNQETLTRINRKLESLLVNNRVEISKLTKKHRQTIREARHQKQSGNQSKAIVTNLSGSQQACPRCNGELKLRSGKYGQFDGCMHYPKCRYTANVKE